MKKKSGLNTGVAVDTVFTLTLFVVFAVAVLLVMLTGAEVYKDAASATTDTGNTRIANAYIVSKLHHFDTENESSGISVKDEGQGSILVLNEEIEGTAVTTYIYCAGGYFRELWQGADDPFDPELGEKFLPADSFEAELDGTLLTFSVDEGDRMAVCVRSAAGGDV